VEAEGRSQGITERVTVEVRVMGMDLNWRFTLSMGLLVGL
jgi:hypothetical protein